MANKNEQPDPDIYFDGKIFRYHVNGKDATKEVKRRQEYRAKEKRLESRWSVISNLILDLSESWKKKELNDIEFQHKVRSEINDHCESSGFIEFTDFK